MNDVNIKGRKCFISAVAYVHNNTKSELEYFFSNVVRRINAGFENFELILVCDDDDGFSCGTHVAQYRK